jgi:hypothetical protein
MSYQYLSGVEEVTKNLLEFPVKVEAQVTRAGVRRMAEVIAAEVQFRVPVRTAALAATIRVVARRRGKEVSAGVRVGDRKKGVFYAHMVLGGTKPHVIKARPRGVLRFAGVVYRSVQHPGSRPNPFVERAIAASGHTAIEAGFAVVTERIKRIIARDRASTSGPRTARGPEG